MENKCSIPKWLGFSKWYNNHFSAICYAHDVAYGNLHPKMLTRKQADDAYRKGLSDLGYSALGFMAWCFLRAFGGFWWQEGK